MVISSNVTYFVRDIVRFIEKLEEVAAERILISIWSVPNPYHHARLFRLVYGEDQEIVPGLRDLLPVLWEMGILPDIRVMPLLPWWEIEDISTRDEAVEGALYGSWLRPEDRDQARSVIEFHFDELFATTAQGFSPRWHPGMRELLITWEANASR